MMPQTAQSPLVQTWSMVFETFMLTTLMLASAREVLTEKVGELLKLLALPEQAVKAAMCARVLRVLAVG